jgi:hypothetical protein
MRTVTKDRARQFGYMLEESTEPMAVDYLSQVVTPADGDDAFYGMPYGCVIGPDGTVYVLNKYAVHGVIAAILCPEQAKAFGAPQPTGNRDNPPVMAYQEFELECNYKLPLVRISCRFGFNVSHGRNECWPTAEQIKALGRILKANDLLTGKIRTEISFEAYGNDYLNLLRLGEQDAEHNDRMEAFAKEEMEKNPNDYVSPELVVAGFNDLV